MLNLKKYHLTENAQVLSPSLPGPNSKALIALQNRIEGAIVSYPKKMPIALKRAKGAIVEDEDGNLFIDFFAGCGVLNVGHSNPDVLQKVIQQQEALIHALDFPTKNKLTYIEKILNQLPEAERENYKVSFCASTGSDAIEAAIKLAKHATGKQEIIAFQGGYHGMTGQALGVTSNIGHKRKVAQYHSPTHFIPYSYCYQCPFGKKPSSCQLECTQHLESLLENPMSGIIQPAAILLEPVQGEGGTVIPKEGYLEEVVRIAKKHQVLTIFDEIQSGFFRTGKFMAFQHTNAMPDIITLSKGLGGIGLPLSAIVYRKEIETWDTAYHIGTFRGNQAGIAAGNAAYDFIVENQLEAHVIEIGNYFLEKLREVQQESDFIGDVRGKGLFISVEYVKNVESKQPFPEFVAQLREQCFQTGLLFEVGGHYDHVIRFVPPLTITKTIVDNAIAIFREAHQKIAATFQPQLLAESL